MMKKRLFTKLDEILSDKTSGSVEILFSLQNFFKLYYKDITSLSKTIQHIKKKLSAFQNVQKYLTELNKIYIGRKNINGFFIKYDHLFLNVYDDIYNNCRNTLKQFPTIITLSNSKTVYEILIRLKKDNPFLKVIVCESRPKLEGRIIAKRLSKKKIKIELITEANITDAVNKCDAALIGADTILRNKNVINKIGSNSLAVICRYYKKPFYVIADKQKFSTKIAFDKKKMPPEEIWRHQGKNIKISNFYFEEINKSLITKIFTD